VLKASEVGVFKQTWPQVCMNSHRGRETAWLTCCAVSGAVGAVVIKP
jgi:hypothetical protein